MEIKENSDSLDEQQLAETINQNRQMAKDYTEGTPQWQQPNTRRFFQLGMPRFRGIKLGVGLGLLNVALAAIIAGGWYFLADEAYDFGLASGTTSYLGMVGAILLALFTIAVLGISSIGLPLMLVRGKGRKRAFVTFLIEFIIILFAASASFGWAFVPGSSTDINYDTCCNGGACGTDLSMMSCGPEL